MGIFNSMNVGLTGLLSHSQAMGTIGDNIANVNTAGFKHSRANFSSMLRGSMLGSNSGSRIENTQQMFGQGDLEITGNVLDMAVGGDGFFIVRGNGDNADVNYYTRSGQFSVDNDGTLVNQQGMAVQGYGVDNNFSLLPGISDLSIADITAPPKVSTALSVNVNLDAAGADLTGVALDVTDPTTYNFSTSATVYDSLGDQHQVDIFYQKQGTTGWTVNVMDPTNPGTVAVSGNATFNSDGTLNTDPGLTIAFTPAGSIAAPLSVALDLTGSTQFANESALRGLAQDGYGTGELMGLDVDENGVITGTFTNSEQLTLGRVGLAKFSANEGLNAIGDNLWQQTVSSGDAIVGGANAGGRGRVVSSSLEASNVDLTYEFVRMIASQRGFQANSKIIQTGDTLLQEVINLKR
jgi:flagellar hook protein FlgE